METSSTPEKAEIQSPPSRTFGPDLARRAAITIAILAIYQAGRLIPIAGINPDFSFAKDGTNSAIAYDLAPTLSYFALGVTPLFSLLLLWEVFKLAFSDVRSWATENRRTCYLANKSLIVAALALAAFQAYGLSAALEALQANYGARAALPVPEPGPLFRLSYIAGVVTGTALSIWLADQITRHGTGSGFWLLFVLPSLIALAATPATVLTHIANGDVSSTSVIALLAVLVASAAAVISLTRQWIALAPATPEFDSASDMARIVVWPPLMATSATAMIAAFMNFFVSTDPEGGNQWLQRGSLGSAIWIAALITVLTYAMANGMLDAKTRTLRDTHKLLGLTVVTASATCIAIDLLAAHFVPFGIAGTVWIAILAVFALLLPRDATAYFPASASDGGTSAA